ITKDPVRLFESHYEMDFYTWGDDECCLDRGATSATLIGKLVKKEDEPECPPPEYPSGKKDEKQQSGYDRSTGTYEKTDQQYQTTTDSGAKYDQNEQAYGAPAYDKSGSPPKPQDPNDGYGNSEPGSQQPATPELHLQPGDFLIFEEVIGPKTGNPSDAD